jgi:hypothetical protein
MKGAAGKKTLTNGGKKGQKNNDKEQITRGAGWDSENGKTQARGGKRTGLGEGTEIK